MRHFQRKEKNFSINSALRDYAQELGWRKGDFDRIKELSGLVGIPTKTISDLLQNVRAVGPQLQARLFIGTGDARFQPRDELEKDAYEEWKKNPTAPKTVAKGGDKAPALSPEPDNPVYLHEQLIRLFNENKIGSKGYEHRAVEKWLKMSESLYRPLLRKQGHFTVGIKVRMYLGFNAPAFAPLNENEKSRCEFWRQQIPRPLPFVKTECQGADEKTSVKTPDEALVSVSVIAQALLADEAFLTRLAVKIRARLEPRSVAPAPVVPALAAGQKAEAPEPEKTAAAATEDIPDGEVISAAFIKSVSDLLRDTISKLNTVVSLGNAPRKNVQTELESLFKKLENALVECLLLARASSRTATREAAMQMLQGERGFLDKLRKSGLTDKQ